MVKVILPYPISANRYWRTYLPKGRRRPVTTVSQDAKAYKARVAYILAENGVIRPSEAIVSIRYVLYPRLPKDHLRRARKDPFHWHKSVQCIDLDNAQKVMIDALKGIAIADDSQVWKIVGLRGVPDEKGARVELEIEEGENWMR